MLLTASDAVSARLDRLERESRRWRRVALGSWLAIAALLLLGQSPTRASRPTSPARTVEAERFVLRDPRGRTGATLGWEGDDTPRLTLHDPSGQPRAVLAVGAGGAPGLTLFDTDGTTVRAALVVGPDGAPGLALFDPAGKPRLAAALFHGSAPGRSTGGHEPAPAPTTRPAWCARPSGSAGPTRGSSWRTAGAQPGPCCASSRTARQTS
jgi:hypothetical protein